MLKSLRARLILSHIVPLLILIPIMGIAIIYVLENRFYLPSLSNELESDARYLANLLGKQEAPWQDPQAASRAIAQEPQTRASRLTLLTPEGLILASSSANRAGQTVDPALFGEALKGQVVKRIQFNRQLQSEAIDVFVPAYSPGGELRGIVRLTYPYASIADELAQLRLFIAGLMVVALAAGSLMGYLLATSIASPVREVTQAVDELARGSRAQLLAGHGPAEIHYLADSVNFLVTRLRELEQSRRKLLANLVHELGRPLGAMRFAIEALARGANRDPELYKELVQGMDGEAERLQRLVDDLAHLHDQVLGVLELDRQPVVLSEWLPPVLSAWQEAARRKRVEWVEQLPEDLPAVLADPVRLAQIVGNLVSNAVKFTPPGGRVAVTAGLADGQVYIAVDDTGPGILPEEQELIFQPFAKGTQGTRFPRGMGLGLSIAQDLAKAHGGRIEVESAPGRGSRFTVWLPVEQTGTAVPPG